MTDAPPAPAPVAAPAPAPSNRAGGGVNLDAAFAGFDSLVAHEQTPPPERKAPDAKPPEPKPVEKADIKPPQEKPEQKPPDVKPEQKPGEQPPTKIKAATLREELDRTRAEVTEWRTKYEKQAAEAKTNKPDPEKDQLLKDREAWNKRREELETELKFANYERSPEYKEKYQQPFLNEYAKGQKLMTALTMKAPDKTDEFGAVVEAGATRKGTEDDWDKLMAITDEDTANKFIADNFGHNAARITMMRDKVLDLHGQMRKASEDFRKTAGERETQTKETQTKAQQESSERWHSANKFAAEKYPELFGADPADQKGTELLTHGQRLTDLAFGVLDPSEFEKLPKSIQDKMVDGKLPPQEMTMLHSAIRNRSAAHDRLMFRLKSTQAELKAATDKLAGYEVSEPGRGEQRRVEQPGKKKGANGSWAEIDAEWDRLAAGNS